MRMSWSWVRLLGIEQVHFELQFFEARALIIHGIPTTCVYRLGKTIQNQKDMQLRIFQKAARRASSEKQPNTVNKITRPSASSFHQLSLVLLK